MKKDFEVIKCPYCGAEYLPSEIYIPNAFFGKPGHVERTFDGKILEYDGTGLDTKETYRCDSCNKEFYVNAQIHFTSSVSELSKLDEEYSSPLNVKKISLFEGD